MELPQYALPKLGSVKDTSLGEHLTLERSTQESSGGQINESIDDA